MHGEYKVPGGKLVVADLDVVDGHIAAFHLAGDFFLEPPEALADIVRALEGAPADLGEEDLAGRVRETLDEGVELVDDWNGIGQRLTASGTTRLHGATAPAERLMTMAVPANLLGFSFVWLILAATGAGRAEDAGEFAV